MALWGLPGPHRHTAGVIQCASIIERRPLFPSSGLSQQLPPAQDPTVDTSYGCGEHKDPVA